MTGGNAVLPSVQRSCSVLSGGFARKGRHRRSLSPRGCCDMGKLSFKRTVGVRSTVTCGSQQHRGSRERVSMQISVYCQWILCPQLHMEWRRESKCGIFFSLAWWESWAPVMLLAMPWPGDVSISPCIKISVFIRISSKDNKPENFSFFKFKNQMQIPLWWFQNVLQLWNFQSGGWKLFTKAFLRARGSAPVISLASLGVKSNRHSPLFSNNLWMEWIQETQFAKAAKSSNVIDNVPSSVKQLLSQMLLGNKDKWSLRAPEVVIFSLSPSLSCEVWRNALIL